MNVSEALHIDKILEYSGYNNSAQRTIIAADGFEIFGENLTRGYSDIVNLAKGFSGSTVAAGKISFGLRWINLLKATIHLAQDFRRISDIPSLIDIINDVELRAVIEA